MMKVMHYSSPLGDLLLAEKDQHLVGAWFEGAKYYGSVLEDTLTEDPDSQTLRKAAAWLDAYFAGERTDPAVLPIVLSGSVFRQSVMRKLMDIPYGMTTTYGAIASHLQRETGKPVSAQAVGGAVGHNPISIIIPCHRVLGAGGSLTGYAGGVEKKQWLLHHERERGLA